MLANKSRKPCYKIFFHFLHFSANRNNLQAKRPLENQINLYNFLQMSPQLKLELTKSKASFANSRLNSGFCNKDTTAFANSSGLSAIKICLLGKQFIPESTQFVATTGTLQAIASKILF